MTLQTLLYIVMRRDERKIDSWKVLLVLRLN